MEKTVYVSSRTPLHDFQLNDLVWGSRKLLRIRPKSTSNWTPVSPVSPVSKPCIKVKAKECKRKSGESLKFKVKVNPVSKVEKVLERMRERRVRRKEGLFSFTLRKEEIEQDFVRVTGRVPERKIKVKKVFTSADDEKEYIAYQKYLKEIVPGNWLSGIFCV
ncbi:hypothetical protein POM88_038143 [Heracleum sosnowskyi]|uniref:Uncharacterized protein n=1 Tax=Heracleum sosnowskyi TaxID=360622 RepID=A0AAD8HRU7_9APIA|nr:hypothetical protein POM88_038143 [Heracleum sosnowskyi]